MGNDRSGVVRELLPHERGRAAAETPPAPPDADACRLLSRRRFLALLGAGAGALTLPLARPTPAGAAASGLTRVDGHVAPNAADGYWDRPGETAHAALLAFMEAHPEAFALPTFRPSDMRVVTSGVQAERLGRRHDGDDYAVADRPLSAMFRARLSVCWQPERGNGDGTVTPGGGWVYTLQYEPGEAFRTANPADPLRAARFTAMYLHCAAPRGLTGDCLRERGFNPRRPAGMPARPPGIFLRVVEAGETFGESGRSGTHRGPTGRHLDLRLSFVDGQGRRRYSDTKMYMNRLLARGDAYNRRQHYLLDYTVAHQVTWERVEGVFRSLARAGLERAFRKLARSPFLRELEGGQDFALRCAKTYGVRLDEAAGRPAREPGGTRAGGEEAPR